MASLTGILLDVSDSMRFSIGKGTDEEGGPWARSIFEVIDNLIKNDISSDNHVFAIGFGASRGEEVFDIIGTLKQIPNQDTAVQVPVTADHINEIFDKLEGAGARSIRKWATVKVVSKALTDNLAVVFLKKFESDQPFLKVFVEKCLPPACRDWPEHSREPEHNGEPVPRGILITPSDLLWKLAVMTANSAYATLATTFRTATVADVKEVVEKAKAYLLKKVDVDSIFQVKDASNVLHGCVDEKELSKERGRELLQSVEPYIYGGTPFYKSIEKAIELFRASSFSSHKKLLFILSDGDPTDGETTDRDQVVQKLTEAGVTVVSCFVTDSGQVVPKRLFSRMGPLWKSGEKFMFSLSSKLSTQSLPRTIFVDRGWTIDITNNVTHLFLQVNHPDHLREACEVARKVVCSQDALSDFIVSVDLDLYINREVKGYKAKKGQEEDEETCYAHASATVLHLSMRRILGREGSYPDFEELKDEFINRFGKDGASTFSVLQEMCPEYRLQCKKVDLEGAMKAITSSRPVVATFRLTEHEWANFDEFYKGNPKGILTKKKLTANKTARLPKANTSTTGHAVVLTSFDSECLRLLNSYGEEWADSGFFRVQKADVLGFQFIDVFWTEEDLKEEEKTYFKKQGSIVAEKLMKWLPSLKDAEFTCPMADCSKRSPVMEFTGTLSHAKCPKCGNEFSTEKAQEGNILALNIYLTSLIR